MSPDIIYVPYSGMFTYLSTIIDAFTKQILSYVLSGSLEVEIRKGNCKHTCQGHGVSLQGETLIHSDQ